MAVDPSSGAVYVANAGANHDGHSVCRVPPSGGVWASAVLNRGCGSKGTHREREREREREKVSE